MAGAIVQVKTAEGGGGSSTTLASGTLVSNVTSGNLLWVVVNSDNAPSVTLSKNSGTATIGSFTSHGSVQEPAVFDTTHHFTCDITGSGTLDILATFGTSQPERVIAVAEISGCSTVDGSHEVSSNNGPTDTMTVNVSTQPAFGLSFCVNLQGTGTGVGTGWTSHTVVDWTATIGEGILQYKAITATGNTTANFTNPGNDRCNTVMLVLLDSGGGGGGGQPITARLGGLPSGNRPLFGRGW